MVQTRSKLIKEGFKFYAIYNSTTGFVFHFILDKLKDNYKETEVNFVMQMLKTLPDRKFPFDSGKKSMRCWYGQLSYLWFNTCQM